MKKQFLYSDGLYCTASIIQLWYCINNQVCLTFIEDDIKDIRNNKKLTILGAQWNYTSFRVSIEFCTTYQLFIETHCTYKLLHKNLMVQRSTHLVLTCNGNVLYINVNCDAVNKWKEKGFNVNTLCMGFSKIKAIFDK